MGPTTFTATYAGTQTKRGNIPQQPQRAMVLASPPFPSFCWLWKRRCSFFSVSFLSVLNTLVLIPLCNSRLRRFLFVHRQLNLSQKLIHTYMHFHLPYTLSLFMSGFNDTLQAQFFHSVLPCYNPVLALWTCSPVASGERKLIVVFGYMGQKKRRKKDHSLRENQHSFSTPCKIISHHIGTWLTSHFWP